MCNVLDLTRSFALVGDISDHALLDLGDYVRWCPDRLLSWPELLEHRVVVVLGEAGAGKTSELSFQARRWQRTSFSVFRHINEVIEGGLCGSLMADDQARLERWQAGDGLGYVFLDAVDEAFLQRRCSPLRPALAAVTRDVGLSALRRLRLVLSARCTDWHPTEDDLETLAAVRTRSEAAEGSDACSASGPNVCVVHLAPLDPPRVRRLAAHRHVQRIDEFMEAVEQLGAWPLVQRPGDVLLLVDHWNRTGQLGSLLEVMEESVRPLAPASSPPSVR